MCDTHFLHPSPIGEQVDWPQEFAVVNSIALMNKCLCSVRI